MTFSNLLELFFLFLSELLFLQIVFFIHLPRRKKFVLRVICTLTLIVAIGTFLTWVWAMLQNPLAMLVLVGSIYFAVIFIMTIIGFYFCFDINVKQVICFTTAGYALQHISSTILSIVQTISLHLSPEINLPWKTFEILLCAILAVLIYLYLRRKNLLESEFMNGKTIFICLVAILVYSAVSMNVGELATLRIALIVKIYAIIAAMFSILALSSQLRNNKVDYDNKIIEQLLHYEKQQHEMQKETVELINVKCHDLKHQIKMLETMDESERKSSIKELQNAILIYDSNVKTGNDALDLILTEKSLTCTSRDIIFNYIADGDKLNFIAISDIYSLFGNLLDNAIESVISEPDTDKRFINLQIREHRNILHIHCANYCAEEPIFKDGLPVSTKQDKNNHGFGTKSIRFIVKKYGGELNITYVESKFVVDIIFNVK